MSLLQPLLVQSGLILRMLKILPLLQVLGLLLTELSPQDLHMRVGLTLGLIQCLRQLALLLASLSCIRSQLLDLGEQKLRISATLWRWAIDSLTR